MNFNKIQAIAKHQFLWEKNHYLFALFAVLITKIALMIFNPLPYIALLGTVATAIPVVFLLKPEFTGRDKTFSAKYVLSFPLTRKEYIATASLLFVLMAIPFLLWLVCFYEQIYFVFSVFKTSPVAAFNILCACVLVASFALEGLFGKARTTQVKMTFKEKSFLLLYGYAILFFVFIAWLAIGDFFDYYFNWDLDSAIFNLNTIDSILIGVLFLAGAFYNYFRASDVSKYDINSFKAPWSLKKELIRLGGLGLATFVCGYFASKIPPAAFKGELQSAVYYRDYGKIKKLLNSGVDINQANEFGATPMMAALVDGNLKLVKFLEGKGANYSGEIKRKNDKLHGFDARMLAIFDGNIELLKYMKNKVPSFNISNSAHTYYPIHLAASKCYSDSINFLIENGADIEVKNSKGHTPLVIAARRNCFGHVVSLTEAGARYDVKGVDGKLALKDLDEDTSPELEHFIKKNLRAPANKN